MKLFGRIAGGAAAVAAFLGVSGVAQEVEPPFAWKGKGLVSFIAESGIKEINFTFELSVDASGGIKGKTSSEEGDSAIKHLFYGPRVEHELPGYYSRKAILVLVINERSAEPLLAVLNGRLLGGRFFTGEALVRRSEPGSETDKALGVGNPVATEIEADSLPSSLTAALRKTVPIGMVKIEGAYQK